MLTPKAIPINNWQRLARFCDFFEGNHLKSNINAAGTAYNYNNAYINARPCFVLVKGARVLKLHADVERKVVAAFPQHRFIGKL